MNPDHSRMKRRPSDRPMPPVRTLRGDIHSAPAPGNAWISPVRSGVAVPPTPPAGDARLVVEPVPGLQPLAEPLMHAEPDLPVASWTEIAPDEIVEELVLEEEVFWVDDPGALVKALEHGKSIAPIEGLTMTGDVARTERDTMPEPPPVNAWDLSTTRPPSASETEEQEQWARSGWEVLSRAFAESTPSVDPREEIAPEPVASAESDILAADPEPEPAEPDPTELATRLERLADQIRMHGAQALEPSRTGGDPMDAALAAALAGLLARQEH